MQGVGERRDGLPKAMRRFGVLHVYLDCDNGFWTFIKTYQIVHFKCTVYYSRV